MLTESFVASVLISEKSTSNSALKDASVYIHEYQPQKALRSTFKKSSTKSNCLASSATHIFAAQADKAVICVYNIERGNQEAVVPFPEKICSIALVGDASGGGILALGAEGGRVILWELCTGRQISTPQAHLQPITCLAADQTSNFLLSGSPDSNIYVWSIPTLLSFSSTSSDPGQPSPLSPLRALSNHRGEVTALTLGHSSSSTNIAISGSKDETCIIWSYQTGTLLHTFLLPTTPLCLTLDPADRGFYIGFEDGSIQLVDFFKKPSMSHSLHDPVLRSTPTQPPASDRWNLPAENASGALCIDLSYDGTVLLSGHENGKVQTWDVGKGRYNTQIADFSYPITNLRMLSPTGFPNQPQHILKIQSIVKPRYDAALGKQAISSIVPENYAFTAQFSTFLPLPRLSQSDHSTSKDPLLSYTAALNSRSFPTDLLEEGIAAISALRHPNSTPSFAKPSNTDEEEQSKDLEIANLKIQLQHAKTSQQIYVDKALQLNDQLLLLREIERRRVDRKRRRRERRERVEEVERKKFMGEPVEEMEVDEGEGEDEEGLSSDTDEMESE